MRSLEGLSIEKMNTSSPFNFSIYRAFKQRYYCVRIVLENRIYNNVQILRYKCLHYIQRDNLIIIIMFGVKFFDSLYKEF